MQPGEVRWTAAWNWALIHPFCSLLMNTDNGKSVDAKTPQFLWIYRLIFCTSSSHFYACAKWWHSWCKVLPNYHRDIFTLHFHCYGKWLQVSKAKENVLFSREKEYSEQKMKWICYPHCCLQITCVDMHCFVYRKPYLPLYLCLKCFTFKVVCDHQELFREKQEEHQSQLQPCVGTASFTFLTW